MEWNACQRTKRKAPFWPPCPPAFPSGFVLTAVAGELEQEGEQVDEIEIERQCTHDGGLAEDIRTLDRKVHDLDLPRVVGGEHREQQPAERADGERHGVRLQDKNIGTAPCRGRVG